jgi:hypothetical protein
VESLVIGVGWFGVDVWDVGFCSILGCLWTLTFSGVGGGVFMYGGNICRFVVGKCMLRSS